MTFFLWAQASRLAAQTPPQRNRYVDFLRAASICVVILGHWLLVAPYLEDGQLVAADALSLIPWTRWLTWLLQVMPIFFLVGGFSNGIGLAVGPTAAGWVCPVAGRSVAAAGQPGSARAGCLDADRSGRGPAWRRSCVIEGRFPVCAAAGLVSGGLHSGGPARPVGVPRLATLWFRLVLGAGGRRSTRGPAGPWARAGGRSAGSTICSSGWRSISLALPGRLAVWPGRGAVCHGPSAGWRR